ncbi:MAG: hypothetical protein ABIN36_14595 [Ferruginibacter sp.]
MFFSLALFAQDSTRILTNLKINSLLSKIYDNSIVPKEKDELKQLTYLIQNNGFTLEEISHDYQNSLLDIEKSLSIWIAMKDTLNEANNRKFRGYLLGHLKRFSEAKQEINQAINLFKTKNRLFGIAVSESDLSKVYEMESNLDSAIFFASSASSYWRDKEDTFRIISNNIQLMNLFNKSKRYIEAEKLQFLTKHMINENLHWRPLIDFYFVSGQLFSNLHKKKLHRFYKKLYTHKLKELRKGGTTIISYYALAN